MIWLGFIIRVIHIHSFWFNVAIKNDIFSLGRYSGSAAALQVKCSWFDPDLGWLSLWSFACFRGFTLGPVFLRFSKTCRSLPLCECICRLPCDGMPSHSWCIPISCPAYPTEVPYPLFYLDQDKMITGDKWMNECLLYYYINLWIEF